MFQQTHFGVPEINLWGFSSGVVAERQVSLPKYRENWNVFRPILDL